MNAQQIGSIVALGLLASSASGCISDVKPASDIELIAERHLPAALAGSMPSFVEVRDGRLIGAAMFDPMLTILDSTGAVAGRYDMRQHRGFGRITTMGMSQDGRRLLVLDGGRSVIRVLRIDSTAITAEAPIPTSMYGQTTGMCLAGNRIFVIGSRDAADSTVIHEISWQGRVLSSFAQPRTADIEELRGMRQSKFACSADRVALAPPGQSYITLFDLDGRPRAALQVPHHADPVYEKSMDPFAPRVRRNEFDGWLEMFYAPDQSLVVQYAHYAGRNLDKTVTHRFDAEKSTWSARTYKVPPIITLGPLHAYAAPMVDRVITRYRYGSN